MPAATFTPTSSGAETIANTYLDNRQEAAAVTPLADGGYLVAWHSLNQPGDNGFGIYAQRFNANGSANGSEIHVNTTTGDHQAGPAAVAQPGGGFTILWTSFQGGSNDIMAQRFDASGAKLGGEFAIANSADIHEQNVNAVALADGSFVVSWDHDPAGAGNRIEMGRHIDAGWNPLGSTFTVSSTFNLDGGSLVHTQDPAALAALGDAVISLSSPGPAPVWEGDKPGQPLAPRPTGDSVMNTPSSMLFAPVVTVPLLAVGGLPLGVQLLGQQHQDARMVALARWMLSA